MTWFRVDDGLHDHRKARKAGTEAMGLWVLCGSWSSKALTDGFVPTDIVKRYGTVRLAQRLVEAELWHADEHEGEQGFRFHQWSPTNPLRADVECSRERSRERMANVRANKQRSSPNGSRTPSLPVPKEPPNPPPSGGPTNPRALGSNPRGAKPPSTADAWLAAHTEEVCRDAG